MSHLWHGGPQPQPQIPFYVGDKVVITSDKAGSIHEIIEVIPTTPGNYTYKLATGSIVPHNLLTLVSSKHATKSARGRRNTRRNRKSRNTRRHRKN